MAEKYLIVLEIDEVQEDATMQTLPLHSTLMHWVTVPGGAGDLVAASQRFSELQSPFEISGGKADLYGPNNDRPVNRIDNAQDVISVHKRLFTYLEEIGAEHQVPEWGFDGYSPHVSETEGKRFGPGENFMVDHIYPVSQVIDGPKQRHILARLALEGSSG